MSDRYARLFEEGREKYDSAGEAWEALKKSREKIDWDPDAVRRD